MPPKISKKELDEIQLQNERLELELAISRERKRQDALRRDLEAENAGVDAATPAPDVAGLALQDITAGRDVIITVVGSSAALIISSFALSLLVAWLIYPQSGAALCAVGAFVISGGLTLAIIHKSNVGQFVTGGVGVFLLTNGSGIGGAAVVGAGSATAAFGGSVVAETLMRESQSDTNMDVKFVDYQYVPLSLIAPIERAASHVKRIISGIGCPKGMRWATDRCESICSPGSLWNLDKCEQICPPGTQWNAGKCDSVCPAGMKWGDGKCEAVCLIGQEWTDNGCEAICGYGQRWNENRCESLCPLEMAFIAGFEPGDALAPRGRYPTHDLCMDLTEVTADDYRRCVFDGKCAAPPSDDGCNWSVPGRGNHPVECATLQEAKTFCKYKGKYLPTEWEWEWAARGRDEGRIHPWGKAKATCKRAVLFDDPGEVRAFDDPRPRPSGCNRESTWPVGSKPLGDSRDGLKDMLGNVFEWTDSRSADGAVVRGGDYNLILDGGDLKVTDSWDISPEEEELGNGFRCAKLAPG